MGILIEKRVAGALSFEKRTREDLRNKASGIYPFSVLFKLFASS